MGALSIKKLAGQTAIYGISSVLGRAISFLLLPLYTAVFTTAEYGIQSLVYVYAPVIFVFFILRFDTAYFRFAVDEAWKDRAFNTIYTGVGAASLVGSALLFFAAPWLANVVFNIPEHYTYVIRILAFILLFDGLSEIAFARLRLENKAMRFAAIRLINIGVNVGLNCFFILFIPWYLSRYSGTSLFDFYDEKLGIGYIFISNVIASGLMFLLLMPQWKEVRIDVDRELLKKVWSYSWPLVVVSLAGIVNELIDRAMLDRLLPYDDETNKAQVGIYSAAYKFSILISLFTQAFRYAAEPFFFSHAGDKKSPMIYAKITNYFVLAACIGFLLIMFGMPWLKHLMRQTQYHEGIVVVPILIMANIFLGIYFNLSVWYKLTDKTRYAMYIALGGACVTIVLNFIFIPMWGYVGSAWATLACYVAMTFASYFIGRRYYPLRHNMWLLVGMMVITLLIYFGVMSIL